MAEWNHAINLPYTAFLSRFEIGRCRYVNKEILVFFNARRCFALSTIALASFSLTGCFTEEVDSRQTQEIRGLIYKVHADDPFTGRILNYPMSVLGLFSVGTCSIDVKKGLPDGEMRCSDNAEHLLAVGEFKAGKRDGKEEKFDAKTGNKITEANWKRGVQDGLQEQFNPQNGERILEVHYTAGKKDDQERAWDDQGKVLIADLVWQNGKQTGFDNRGTQHRTYLEGEYHGPQKDYGLDGNRFYVSQEENYENGELHGTQKRINARGKVTELSEFEHGKLKARTVDEYSYDGQHLHHVSRLAIKEDVNQYIASDLSNDGLEQYWDNDGHLIRELQWNKGKLVSATATIWLGDKQISQYQGVAQRGYDNHQDDVVKHGQERIYDRNGELAAVVVWNAGKVTNTIVNLPSDLRSQYPGKMAMLNPNVDWGSPVEEIPDFESPSRYGGGGFAVDYATIVDIPAPGQLIQNLPTQKPVLAAASSSNNLDACVQQKVDAVHAENPEALVRADMLEEFEQDCQ